MLRDRCERGFFLQSAGQGGVKAYRSHACSWLGDNPGGGWGRRKKILSFPFKQGKSYIPPETVPKLLSDPERLETVKF